jgi:hypothetical protein
VSRIADAFARAGRSLPEEHSAEWDAERAAAEAHLNGLTPEAARPSSEGRFHSDLPVAPKPRRTELNDSARVIEPTAAASADRHEEHGDALQRSDEHIGPHRSGSVEKYPAGDDFHDVLKRLQAELSSAFDEGRLGTTDARRRGRGDAELRHSELAAAVRHIFFGARGTQIRSVLFCTVPGDSACDVAWQAAEVLAAQSDRRIAFVDDSSDSVVPTPVGGNEPITRIARRDLGAAWAHTDISQLRSSFAFVIVNATASRVDDLVPLARGVDAVIVVVNADQTRADAGEELVATLRSAGAHIVGAVLATSARSSRGTPVRFRG